MSPLTVVHPMEAAALVKGGAILVDVRGEDEFRRVHIPGAVPAPLAGLPAGLPQGAGSRLIFHCRTGMRTGAQAARLAEMAGGAAYVLAGGLDAWRAAGLPVVEDDRQPLEIMRQVQICAGALILSAVVLGWLVAPGFYTLAGLMGFGLLMAGLTGFCGMARVLTWINARILALQAR